MQELVRNFEANEQFLRAENTRVGGDARLAKTQHDQDMETMNAEMKKLEEELARRQNGMAIARRDAERCTALQNAAKARKAAMRADQATSVYVDAECRDAWISIIKMAEFKIMIAAYCMTDTSIVDAVVEAIEKREVVVHVVVDSEQVQCHEAMQKVVTRLEAHGARLRCTSGRVEGGIMHLKVVIADNRVAASGSYNPTFKATKRNTESVTILKEHDAVRQLVKQFQQVWSEADGTGTDPSVSATDVGVETPASVLGADRLLFACDMSYTAGIGKIRSAEIPEKAKQKILGGNMQKLLAARKVASTC